MASAKAFPPLPAENPPPDPFPPFPPFASICRLAESEPVSFPVPVALAVPPLAPLPVPPVLGDPPAPPSANAPSPGKVSSMVVEELTVEMAVPFPPGVAWDKFAHHLAPLSMHAAVY